MNPVKGYTLKGKFLLFILRLLFIPIFLIKGRKWQRPRVFEENPATMSWKDLIYFGYKYYFKPPLKAENDDIEKHFSQFSNTLKTVNFNERTDFLSISIAGDLMPYELINENTCQNLWDIIGEDFFEKDIVLANLETPIDVTKPPSFVPEVMLNHMLFNTNEKTFDIFSGKPHFKGYDVLSIANNHSWDMGEQGLRNTIHFLESKNIKTCGANFEKSKKYSIIDKKGIKVGFMAFTYCLNEFVLSKEKEDLINVLPFNLPNCPIDKFKNEVNELRKLGAEFIILSLHGGNAYQPFPNQHTIDLYRKIVNECGIDLIAGGHPHNLQPWETIEYFDKISNQEKQSFIIYSLADFVAFDVFEWCHHKAYLDLKIQKQNTKLEWEIKVKEVRMIKEGNSLFFENI